MITDDEHWNILISHVLQMKRRDWTNSSDFVTTCVIDVSSCSCLLRIIDSFGTEPAFNQDEYAKAHKLKTQWGMQNLNLQQFFTMFRKLRSKDVTRACI